MRIIGATTTATPRGWSTQGMVVGLATACLASAGLGFGARGGQPGDKGPPQVLPITAQWCLSGGEASPCIALEVPQSPRQYSMGLQMRPALPPLRGMWFVFPPPSVARFWMHRTLAPLDLIFIANNRILAIAANAPTCPSLPCPSYGPVDPVDGVVELGAGEAQRLGLKVGSPVDIRRLPQPTTLSRPRRG